MSLFSRPLVSLSLTESDQDVLHYAAKLARIFDWSDIHFLHVVSPDHSHTCDPQPWQEKMQVQVSRVFTDSASDGRFMFHAVQGSRLDCILETVVKHERDLIVLGHRRIRSGRRSLALRTAMVAPASVWLVPEGVAPEINDILVPTDFSDHSADSLSVAAEVARAARLKRLRALHVYFDPSTLRFDEHLDDVLGKEEEQFQAHLAGIDTHGVDIERIYHESARPSQAILRVAQQHGSDLIVMSTRGRGRAAFVLLGSTTSETLAATTVPVLAVKHYGGKMSLMQALLHPDLWGRKDPKTN